MSYSLLCLIVALLSVVLAEQEFVAVGTPWVSARNERRLVEHDGRIIQHMHLHSTPLYGNSTDFMYYYITMYFGTHQQPQTLILDTGSSVAAIPCKEFCAHGRCGKHIDDLYETSRSDKFQLYNCKTVDCKCAKPDRCRFYQGYAEGSRYEGYIAKDVLSFGEVEDNRSDMFEYTFGCVQTETNYFYSQQADGILGLSPERPRMNANRFEPIYNVMKEQGIITQRVFSLCLGKDGGYFQIGGYDKTGHLTDSKNGNDVTWINMIYRDKDFKVPFRGIWMNNHLMAETHSQSVAFIDSGTTFTYMNIANYNAIKLHFNWFCSLDPEKHCKGRMSFERQGYLCFSYDEEEFLDGPYDYFRSFPILRFDLGSENDSYVLNWYPSEYLYREKSTRYCVALDVNNDAELMMGGTMMRQHNFVFDVDNNKVGIARASCSHDLNQIKQEEELILAGQRYALDPLHTESQNEVCDHVGYKKRLPRKHHQHDPQPHEKVEESKEYAKQEQSLHHLIKHQKGETEGKDSHILLLTACAIFFALLAICVVKEIIKYCKNSGTHSEVVVEPKRVNRDYSQGSQRDATQAVPYQTEDITVEITSGRKYGAHNGSQRSSDAYKLELQPDSQTRKQPSLEDDYSGEDDDDDDYIEESGEAEAEEDNFEAKESNIPDEKEEQVNINQI